jgi:hypothetical protein
VRNPTGVQINEPQNSMNKGTGARAVLHFLEKMCSAALSIQSTKAQTEPGLQGKIDGCRLATQAQVTSLNQGALDERNSITNTAHATSTIY